MQHIDSGSPANSYPYALPRQLSRKTCSGSGSALLSKLVRGLLLPAVLLGITTKYSFAQTGCALQLTAATTNVECATLGAINLTVAGGTGPYTFAWTGPNGFAASTEDITSLPTGSYTVAVTDNATRCTATATAAVATTPDTTPPILRAAGLEATLVNGSITILADDIDYGSFDTCSGLASIRITPNAFTCANVGSNPVTFTAIDNAGNSAATVVTVLVYADVTCLPLSSPAATATVPRLQVYPNPATSMATVAFVAERTEAAQVIIYNNLSERVATLYNGVVSIGQEYRFTLQSTGLANGVYTCQVRTAGRLYTTRLLIAN